MADDEPASIPLDPAPEAAALARAQARLEATRARDLPPDPGALAPAIDGAAARLAARVAEPAYQARLEAELTRARDRERAALARLADAIGVPGDADLRAVALDPDPAPTPALAAVRAALAWRGPARRGLVLVLAGPCGTGKSCAAAWAALRAPSALVVPALTVGATPRTGWSENEAAWGRWLGAGLLVVDDLGTETGDPEALATLLCQRYDLGRATLATTNDPRARVVERYLRGPIGPRLADRLIHAQGRAVRVDGSWGVGPGGHPWFVPVAGASLRKPGARAALVEGAR